MDNSLIKAKEKLEKIITENQEKQAMKKVLMERLKEEFDLKSIEEAEQYINDLEADIEERTAQYEKDKKELFKKIEDSGILD